LRKTVIVDLATPYRLLTSESARWHVPALVFHCDFTRFCLWLV